MLRCPNWLLGSSSLSLRSLENLAAVLFAPITSAALLCPIFPCPSTRITFMSATLVAWRVTALERSLYVKLRHLHIPEREISLQRSFTATGDTGGRLGSCEIFIACVRVGRTGENRAAQRNMVSSVSLVPATSTRKLLRNNPVEAHVVSFHVFPRL